MLRVARSVCAEFAAGEVLSCHQRPAHGDGTLAEGSLVGLPALLGLQFAQDKFLEKAVEVYLEQAEVPARSNG